MVTLHSTHHALISICFKVHAPSHAGLPDLGVFLNLFHDAARKLLDACAQGALQTWVK